MGSKTEICNFALTKLGQSELINNITTDTTPNAVACRAAWDISRDAVLRDFDWPFALERKTLTRYADAPDSDTWAYQHALPTNPVYLRIKDIPDYDPDAQPVWEIEGDRIFSNEYELTIRYVRQETNTAKYPADFADALACKIAFETALVVTHNMAVKNMAAGMYAAAMQTAQNNAAIEQKSRPQRLTWADRGA